MTHVTLDPANDRRVAIEHVRACCPALISTLVAMARASKAGQDAECSGGRADVAP